LFTEVLKMSKIYVLSLLAASILTACGGASTAPSPEPAPAPTPVPTPTPTSAPVQTTGVITGFGSVFINGVEYETNSATVSTDDNPGADESDLEVGMIVSLNGEVNEDGTTGNANSIHYEEQLKGPLDSIDLLANTLSVLGQVVVFDDETSLDGTLLTELSPADFLEISGFFNAKGELHATRIEKETEVSKLKVEGKVESLDTMNKVFVIHNLTINYSSAVFANFAEIDLSNGQEVRVKGLSSALSNDVFQVNEIKLQKKDEQHEDGKDSQVEGFITDFQSATSFSVSNTHIITDENTEYKFGSVDSLMLNVQVKVKGEYNGAGDLLAQKIHLQQRSNLSMEGTVEAIDLDLRTVTVLGVEFMVTSQTIMKDESDHAERFFNLSDLVLGDSVELKGFIDTDGNNIATKMQREKDDPEGNIELKGAVSNIANFSFDILGVSVNTDETTLFEDINGDNVSQATFFAQLQNDMLLEIKGLLVEGNFVALQIKTEENESDEADEAGEADEDDGTAKSQRTEFKGTVDEINEGALIVSNHEVLINSDTEFEADDNSVSVEQFLQLVVVGDTVKVKGRMDEQGVITAKSIEIDD
jgi:hypothetical protein